MSLTDHACDACSGTLDPPIYRPLQSRRNVHIAVCRRCGLTQSISGSYLPDTRQTVSADADWGNVRHGKGLRLELLTKLLQRDLDWSTIRRILDVGSNRGDFVRWVAKHHPGAAILAVEPDRTLVDYAELDNVVLDHAKLEDIVLQADEFDLVYVCQTLEHATSAADMMRRCGKALRLGGHILIDVPNIEAIGLPDIVEEFFIDKHNYHFDPTGLTAFVESKGFEIVWCSSPPDAYNITILARKIGDDLGAPTGYTTRLPASLAQSNRDLIGDYEHRLGHNRTLLRRLVDEKLRPLAARQKVAYWGAGRIFDALVKYGGLAAGDVHLLVDKHLSKLVAQTHDFPIHRPERLRIVEPHVVVVLARSGEDAIASRAHAMGTRNVLKFSELLAQVADSVDVPTVGKPSLST